MAYVPERGDVVWLDFDPQRGREQAGRRPALALSPSLYNRRSGLALFCPLTSRVKGYPFEVFVPEGGKVSGVVLVDHIKSLDWRSRRIEFIAILPLEVVEEVLGRLEPLLF